MEHSISDIVSWHWFKGNEVTGRLLQDVCLFRSAVLFDSGLRENFGGHGRNFGDTHYADFDSYHVVASQNNIILGTIRITPPEIANVTSSVLGFEDYKAFVASLNYDLKNTIEMNRLMVKADTRKLNLGKMLLYAAVGVIENIWDRERFLIICSAGNCASQASYLKRHSDFETVENMPDRFSELFNDSVSFLKYRQPPYLKGATEIKIFSELFAKQVSLPWSRLEMSFKSTQKNYSDVLDAEL